MGKTVLSVVGWVGIAACGAPLAHSGAPSSIQMDIAAQPLDGAIAAWSVQTGHQVMYAGGGQIDRAISPPVHGSYTAEAALKALLSHTDLGYTYVNPRTVAIVPVSLQKAEPARASDQEGGSSNASGSSAVNTRDGMTEVVVTAQKREERLKDVPVPVTAISAQSLLDRNQLQIRDFYTKVPGLNIAPATLGTPRVVIRGLSTGGGTNPTVGIVVDDVAYGSSTNLGGGSWIPNFDPSDLARVEVLRGPQGTLYGVNSLGGLIKYVTVDPSTDGFSGRVEIGASSVYNGDNEVGHNVRGAVNVPLSDTFALRASGFTRREPGYIDNIQTGEKAVNQTDTDGGRLSALWRPTNDLSLRMSALYQDSDEKGAPYVYAVPGVGDLQQTALPGSGELHSKLQAYSASLEANAGPVTLTYLTGYSINDLVGSTDYSFALGGATTLTRFGVSGVYYQMDNQTTKFTQELRAAVPLGQKVDWLFGGFFTNEHSSSREIGLAADALTGRIAGSWFDVDYPTTYKEYALFTDFTFHLTDRFDVQVGGREARNEQTYSAIWQGPYVPVFLLVPSPLVPPPVSTDENAFTYLLAPRLKLSPNLMLYARLASGYRPGGPNSNSSTNALPVFDSDKTKNYELGMKADFLDQRVTIDASVYYIDWKDMQIQLRDPVTHATFYGNASRSKSQGLELSLDVRPATGLTISSWVAFNDAELTEPIPAGGPVIGEKGTRLPTSSRFSGSLSLDQRFPIGGNFMAFVGGTVSYVGDRYGVFTRTGVRQFFPAYAQTDLSGGVQRDGWTFSLFANNVTDRRGLLPSGATNTVVYYPIRPRTIGASLTKTF